MKLADDAKWMLWCIKKAVIFLCSVKTENVVLMHQRACIEFVL